MYGAQTGDGSWNGMIKMLIDKVTLTSGTQRTLNNYCLIQEVDIIIQLMSHSHSRYQVAEYSVPIEKDPINILTLAPKKHEEFFNCTRPFQNWVMTFHNNASIPLKIELKFQRCGRQSC